MELFIIYLLKVNIVLAILYSSYWVLFRKEKFFVANRFILLACLVCSLLLPLVSIEGEMLQQLEQDIAAANPLTHIYNSISDAPVSTPQPITGRDNTNNADRFFWIRVGAGTYLLITMLLLAAFVRRLWLLYQFFKTHEKIKEGGVTYLFHHRIIPPFSFFHRLVINKTDFSKDEYAQVVAHEKVHIRQWHTLDMLMSELMVIVCWINPLAYRLRNAIKLNLEYIADDTVLNTGVDKKDYQLNILSRCLAPGRYALTNLFSSSKIKLRIKMMNTKNNNKQHWFKYLFLIPLGLACYFIINPLSAQQQQGVKAAVIDHSPHPFKKIYVVIKADTGEDALWSIQDRLKKRGINFNITNTKFDGDLLTAIDVEVNVPGIYKDAVSSDNAGKPLLKPVFFYYEPGTGFQLGKGSIPGDVSGSGSKFLKNNLNGILIYFAGGQEMEGSCKWD